MDPRRKRSDLVTGGAFLVFAMALLAGAAGLPEASGGLPGPGFFPAWIAVASGALAVAVLVRGARGLGESEGLGAVWAVLLFLGLTFAYLLLWGTGLFAVRTAVFLALFLRLAGQSWRASASVAVVLAATVTVAFGLGLGVSLE